MKDWQDMSTAVSAYLGGLNLELFETNSLLYYISVKATNGASQQSVVMTSR